MNFTELKRLFLKVLIGCLIAAAALAVVTILAGSFSDTSTKALFTVLLIALHALIGIAFIDNNEKQDTFDSLEFFTNTTFGLIVLSFITSVLGVWGVIPGDIVARLYALYFVVLFAVLHGEILAKTLGKQSNIDTIVSINYVFMMIVVAMLVPIIFADSSIFSSFYYRLLAACGIIDATLTLVAVILHNLYVQKHPKIVDPVFSVQVLPQVPGQPGQPVQNVPVAVQQPPKKHMNIFVLILLIYVGLQVVGGLFLIILGTLWSINS